MKIKNVFLTKSVVRGLAAAVLTAFALSTTASLFHAGAHPAAEASEAAMFPAIGGKSKNAFLDSLLDRMSLTEQIGQLSMESGSIDPHAGSDKSADSQSGPISAGLDLSIPTGKSEPDSKSRSPGDILADVKAGRTGSFLNVVGAGVARDLQKIAVEQTPNKIPLIFSYDVVRGHRTIFPAPLGEAASWDLDLAERTARAAAVEAYAQGVHWTFAPDADVARDARWGRVMETFGEDPYLVAKMAKAKVRGFQTDKLGAPGTIASTLKHFVGYAAVQGGREYNTVSISPTDLYNVHMPPFIEGVAAGARSVMPSFTDIDSVPMSVNKDLVADTLRARMGFDGVAVSDYKSILETVDHRVSVDTREAGRKALRATLDVDMLGRSFRALETQSLSREERTLIRAAARRVLELKWDLGLFHDPFRNMNTELEKSALLTGPTRRLAREAVAKSVVLLKNEGQLLPLKKGARSAALIGALADDPHELLGPWRAVGRASEVVTPRESFSQPGYFKRMSFAKGSPIVDDKLVVAAVRAHKVDVAQDKRSPKLLLAEAVRFARNADVTIAFVGELALMNSENASRSDLSVPEPQMSLLRALRKNSKRLITIVKAGRPLLMKEVLDLSDAVIYAWEPGTEAGSGLRDVLFGEVVPSAKTTMSFPRAVGQMPLFYNQKTTGRPPIPGMAYLSTYIDVENDALIPFGFGLSYSKFEYGDVTLSKPEMKGDGQDTVTASITVKNTGAYDADEIAQLYVRDDFASIARPELELRGFQRVSLKKGEQKTLEFRIGLDELSFINARFEKVAEPGTFTIMAGGDSTRLAKTRLTLVK